MSAFKNDGTIPYGSMTLTIGSSAGGSGGVVYIADNVSISRTAKTIERTNELDEPSGQVSYKGFTTGSATLQLATTSTVPPQQGYEFTKQFDAVNGSEVWYVDTIETPFQKDGETKVNITFRKKYN